ncbi:glutathionylspermidine synthase family protein [Pedobacter duraquae]|uniref:Glutathionylspermidine synthase n=1 Tax=Pedobacter duraquae TaxID=425511 RepID=A0A4R6IPX7_9SPHI|nr:glutathionylspermidine synthase family protein [Pedobacter duraquae]TDO24362.1 glutathionylspermidine synthase [Pedobacter duraquae]
MERNSIYARNNWQTAVEKLGFGFHTAEIPYWKEDACYEFTLAEITLIEKATAELWGMCLEAVQHIIDHRLYPLFAVPESAVPLIEKSWNEDAPAIYGRFDFGYDGNELKLFEFNADTPTSLFEAGIVQWFWLQDFDKSKDQFNSIHEKLIAYWKYLKPYLFDGTVHFACVKQSLEDLTTTEYMRDCAIQAGLETKLIFIDDLGWDDSQKVFVDMEDQMVSNVFKLYPWEWMVKEPFFEQMLKQQEMYWIEPAWKMLLSNKAILPVLWELFPNCPYLLPTYTEAENPLKNYVKKPLLSREGANVQIVRGDFITAQTKGIYGAEGFICQQIFESKSFHGTTPVIGSWVIGQEAAGIGIRESNKLITDNTSCFVPHLIKG